VNRIALLTAAVVAATTFIAPSGELSAHGGGLDASGCHHDRKRGGYHCHGSKSSYSPPKSYTPKKKSERPAAKPLATAQAASAAPVPRALEVVATVTKIVDGDTLRVVLEDATEAAVRIRGLDCAEMDDTGKEAEAQAAASALSELVLGKEVKLVGTGAELEKDRYGRLLAYVDFDGNDAGYTLVKRGLCRDYSHKYPHPRSRLYLAAQGTSGK
jgi:endonuclease YncB( thermonuclease family)